MRRLIERLRYGAWQSYLKRGPRTFQERSEKLGNPRPQGKEPVMTYGEAVAAHEAAHAAAMREGHRRHQLNGTAESQRPEGSASWMKVVTA